MDVLNVVGHDVPRIDGREKVTGAARFVDDLEFGPALLYAAIVESPHAHAEIVRIDTSRALELAGVVRVVTGGEFSTRFGLFVRDRPVFARERVRFAGEQVAAVIARDPATALRAATLVEIEYAELPAVLDVAAACASSAPLVHPDLGAYSRVPWINSQAGTNIGHHLKVRRGDVEEGFREADVVVEDVFRMPRYAHCALEPHCAVAKLDFGGRLTVWSSSQSPFTQRHLLAQALDLKHRDVRVVTPYVGGGFGGKAGLTMEIMAALLATQVPGHPVRLLWSRAQEFRNTYQRPGLEARVKMGLRNDGTIVALAHTLRWDSGAYVEYGSAVTNAAGLASGGPYRIPHLSIDSLCLYTNLPPTGPFRGFGHPEALFGLESILDAAARRLDLDRVEIRRRNHLREGDLLSYGGRMHAHGLAECIDRVAREIAWDEPEEPSSPGLLTGKGFALFWKGAHMPPNASSAAFVKFNEDGSLHILVGAVELGQGMTVSMAQIASEILAVPLEKVRVETTDTDRSPYEWQTVASHMTWGTGNAVLRAALDARDQVVDLVSRARGVPREALYLDLEAVRSREDASFVLPLRDFVIHGLEMADGTWRGGPIVGRGHHMPEDSSARADRDTGQGRQPVAHFTVGAAAVRIVVDPQTGRIRIPKAVLAIDAGRAINPVGLRDQIVGGLVQGIGTALLEEVRFDDQGRMLNDDLGDYKIPRVPDVPDEIVPIIIEVPQPDGPWGARGAGEHTTIPAAPMIASALEDALGIRLRSMPATPEKIVAAAAGLP